jgi:polyphenol oxidase
MAMTFMSEPQPTGGFEWTQAAPGRVLRCAPLAAIAEHFFTTASVQLRGDEAEWAAVAALAGVPRNRLLLLRQVHGHAIAVARDGDADQWAPPTADGVISGDPTAALVVRVADCTPILLADRRTGAVAAVHAGWRSTMQSIAALAVEAMHRELESDPGDLVAAIGPSLGSCCGEMGEEVVTAFREAGHAEEAIERWFTRQPGRRPHFDLWAANSDQLQAAGVPATSIHVSGLCTRTYPDVFHSFRAAGQQAGRMVGVIRAR